MSTICGIIDFSDNSKGRDFELLRQMWCSVSVLGRAYAYMNNGFSICCDRQQSAFCSLPSAAQKKGENCTLVLDSSPPFPSYTRDILNRYLHDGAQALCELEDKTGFVLFDEADRFVMLSSARTKFYCTRAEDSGKIFFATEERAVYSLLGLGIDLHTPAVTIFPHGLAMHCDLRARI